MSKRLATMRPPSLARLRRLAERLHSLGPRPTFELLKEIANGGDLWRRLERYAELDPEIVRAIGADEMPPLVICISEHNE